MSIGSKKSVKSEVIDEDDVDVDADEFYEALEGIQKPNGEEEVVDEDQDQNFPPEDRWQHVDTDQARLERVGSITITVKDLEKSRMVRAVQRSLAEHAKEVEELRKIRPKIRADCAKIIRPCPFISCKHHLFLEVNPDTGAIRLNFPELEPEADLSQMAETCSLDVAEEADDDGLTLEVTGALMNLTRERINQIVVTAQEKARGLNKILEARAKNRQAQANNPNIVKKNRSAKTSDPLTAKQPEPENTSVIEDKQFTIDDLFS